MTQPPGQRDDPTELRSSLGDLISFYLCQLPYHFVVLTKVCQLGNLTNSHVVASLAWSLMSDFESLFREMLEIHFKTL